MKRDQPPPAVEVTSTLASFGSARKARATRFARTVLEGASPRRGRGASLSLLFCGDARMRRLNREWRKKDKPTDVLSFPSGETGFLGDVVIDVPYAARQARSRGHSLERELQILLVHGVLHLLGFDHEKDDGQMFRKQSLLVKRLFGEGPDGVPEDDEP